MEQSNGISQSSRFTPAPKLSIPTSSLSSSFTPKFNSNMLGGGPIRRPVENRTMTMMTAANDRIRGMRSSRPSMQLGSTTTVDVDATTEYKGRFNEPLDVEKNPLF